MHTFFISLKRELRRIFRQGQSRYLILTSLGIVFCYVFFLTLMREGQPERLPIAIVDQDGSYLSRRLCHEINATQGVRVVAVYPTHTEARRAMQRQEIYAFSKYQKAPTMKCCPSPVPILPYIATMPICSAGRSATVPCPPSVSWRQVRCSARCCAKRAMMRGK